MFHTVPTLTHLQFAAVATIRRHGSMSGRNLRGELLEHGISLSGPAFYQFMARMAQAGWVVVNRKTDPGDGLSVKETYYSLSDSGCEVFQDALDFYLELGSLVAGSMKEVSMRS